MEKNWIDGVATVIGRTDESLGDGGSSFIGGTGPVMKEPGNGI